MLASIIPLSYSKYKAISKNKKNRQIIDRTPKQALLVD